MSSPCAIVGGRRSMDGPGRQRTKETHLHYPHRPSDPRKLSTPSTSECLAPVLAARHPRLSLFPIFHRDATVHKGSTRQCLRHFDRRGDDTFEALVLSGTIQSIDMSPKELVLPVQYLLALSCAIAPDSYGDSATTIPTGSNSRLWFYREPYEGFSRRGLGHELTGSVRWG